MWPCSCSWLVIWSFDASKHSTTDLSLPVKDLSLPGLPVPAAVAWARAGVPRRMVRARAIRMPRSSTGVNVPFAWAQAGRERRRRACWEGADLCHGLTPTPRPPLLGALGEMGICFEVVEPFCCWSNFVALTLWAHEVLLSTRRGSWVKFSKTILLREEGEGRVFSNWS